MPKSTPMKRSGRKSVHWREVLTPEEHETVLKAEAARAKWHALMPQRAFIVNRAIQRAKCQNRLKD